MGLKCLPCPYIWSFTVHFCFRPHPREDQAGCGAGAAAGGGTAERDIDITESATVGRRLYGLPGMEPTAAGMESVLGFLFRVFIFRVFLFTCGLSCGISRSVSWRRSLRSCSAYQRAAPFSPAGPGAGYMYSPEHSPELLRSSSGCAFLFERFRNNECSRSSSLVSCR